MSNENRPITAAVIPEESRLEALPQAFGLAGLWVESMTYGFMRNIDPTYTGGYWDFFNLSNNGFYMAIQNGKPQRISTPNGYEAQVSADAAGIIASLYALGNLANRTEKDLFIEKYHQLMDYARTHPERGEILAAVD
ncbi:antirestriction protein [Pseudoduganella ginsengisoli]|nr:antirestriction protein [Pseudoduganella ginsengisoli]